MEPDFGILLSAVIAAIYDAALDPSKWTLALQRACDFVGGAQAVMFWQGHSAEEVEALHLYNQEPFYTRLFLDKLAPLNPVFPAALFQDVGAVHTATDLIPADELRQTQFYKEWVEPQGLTDSVAVILEKDATRVTLLSFPTVGDVGDDARLRLALLAPHFQRAVSIGRQFVKHSPIASALTDTLNVVDESVFLLSADGDIVFANDRGRRMLGARTLLLASGDRLRATAPAADRALRDGVGVIANAREPVGSQGLTVMLSNTADAQWIATILPLADGERRKVAVDHRAVAAMFVRKSIPAAPSPLETFANRYRLTASEVRVVAALMSVSGLDAMAEALGISRATVKTHLNHVYRKCSARNQSEIVKMIAGIEREAQSR